jgi:hypothetical protein
MLHFIENAMPCARKAIHQKIGEFPPSLFSSTSRWEEFYRSERVMLCCVVPLCRRIASPPNDQRHQPALNILQQPQRHFCNDHGALSQWQPRASTYTLRGLVPNGQCFIASKFCRRTMGETTDTESAELVGAKDWTLLE